MNLEKKLIDDRPAFSRVGCTGGRPSKNKKKDQTVNPPPKSKMPPPKFQLDDLLPLQRIPLTTRGSEQDDQEIGVISADPWDTPLRYYADPLGELELIEPASLERSLEPIGSEIIAELHLPTLEKSVEFRTRTQNPKKPSNCATTEYHRLDRFDTEIVDEIDYNFIAFVGATILSMAWHPSGHFLAVSVMNCNEKNTDDDPNLLESKVTRTSVLIYCQTKVTGCPETAMSLELIIALNYGYVNHLQWCNYWPHAVNRFEAELELCDLKPDEGKGTKIGYLACGMEDSTIRIFSLNVNDFYLAHNYPRTMPKYRVYTKVPEICLSIDPTTKQNLGHCTTFDWHEGHRFLVAGYGSGLLAAFDLGTRSNKLKHVVNQDGSTIVTLYPFWMIKAHVLPVKSVVVDPVTPRYFHSGSMDRYLKTWDIELREEVESKMIGSVIDMSYIRGWLNLAISTDLGASYGNFNIAQNNYVRICQIGTPIYRTNSLESFNITSISFYEGLIAQATESGKTSVTYYDAFWRECDIDRNKKKKNCAVISQLSLDEESFEPIPTFSDPSDDTVNEQLLSTMTLNEEPKLILTFKKERVEAFNQLEANPQEIENCVRFYKYLKINKITWNPRGNLLAIGYKNGLLAIVPASFERVFASVRTSNNRPKKYKKRHR